MHRPAFSFFIFLLLFLNACSFSKKIKDGEMAYERKQFAVAADMLEVEYEESRNEAAKARKAYLLGLSFQKLIEYESARAWFEKAIQHKYGTEALSGYAEVCKNLENYEEAIKTYREIGRLTGRMQEIQREMLLCNQALAYKAGKPEYQIERLLENTSVSDYSPVLYEDQFLVFTSERTEATGRDIYKWTGEKFSDIFIMQKGGSDVRKFDASVNTQDNEGTPWFSRDMQRMYFTRCNAEGNTDGWCYLVASERRQGIWEEAIALPFVRDGIQYGHPTLIENDSILVFSSDMLLPGGPKDLFYTQLLDDGSWTEPEKMPDVINSQGNEVFPTGDRDTLYFSSDYWPGMGGFDIFKTYLRKDGTWTVPENMGYPINSGGDDFSFIIDYNAKSRPKIVRQGFFASSRSGEGKDDIYRFAKLGTQPAKGETLTEKSKKGPSLFVVVKTFTPVYEKADDPNAEITGKTPLSNVLLQFKTASGVLIPNAYTDANGFYFVEVPAGQQIQILGARSGYLNNVVALNTENVKVDTSESTYTFNVELILSRLFVDKEITLRNIYYDFDRWEIREDARPTLDELASMLELNPQINMQLSSHTDCRGDDDYNLELSQRRAQSVVSYLTEKGIAASRLTAVGYGESKLLDNCTCNVCTEEQHQVNRRTTFTILKK